MAVNWAPVYGNALDSIFFIKLTPSEGQRMVAERTRLANVAGSIPIGELRDEALAATPVSTGFKVGVVAGEMGILTTAHSIQHLFTASNPIGPSKINDLFTVHILCSHYENALLEARDVDAPRAYTVGRIGWIDCTRDLMLVVASEANLRRFVGALPCHGPHPALLACPDGIDPPTTHECLLVSWPPYKPDTMSIGRIGTVRTVDEISRPNRVQYAMNLLEVQMSTAEGSSGGPLLDERGEVIGMLHGGHDSSHSYFICIDHVRRFLRRFGILPAPLPAPPVA